MTWILFSDEKGAEMGKVVAKRDTAMQCWARLRLDSGEQIMISMAQSGVKVFKMKWAGLLPGATLWQSKSIAEVAETFFTDDDNPEHRPLDCMINKLIGCRSAADVVVKLIKQKESDNDTFVVLEKYGAVLGKPRRPNLYLIDDISELPYPKNIIKAALQEAFRRFPAQLEYLKVAYVSLADFQKLTEDERKALANTELLAVPRSSIEALRAEAKILSAGATHLERVEARLTKEREELVQDLKSWGLWNEAKLSKGSSH